MRIEIGRTYNYIGTLSEAPRRCARLDPAALSLESWHLRLGSFAFFHDL